MRFVFFVLLAIVVTDASAAPPAAPANEAGVAAAFDALVEPMVRSHLGRCPGVEVHKRGNGFIAGRLGGPLVIVTASISCVEEARPNNETEVVVTKRLSTRSVDGEELRSYDRKITPAKMRCPTEVGASIRYAILERPPHICDEAFTSDWENFGLADFFVPILVPTGEPQFGERDGKPTLRFARGGRELELAGDVRCKRTPNPLDPRPGGMQLLQLMGRLQLVDVSSRRVLGQWNDILISDRAISCDYAFRRPSHPEKMAEARAEWAQHITDAVTRP